MGPIKKKTLKKRLKKKTHNIGTQVTGQELDEIFELMCENPQTTFDFYVEQILKRKKQKYRNILVTGAVAKPSAENLQKKVSYKFGTQTIHRNNKTLDQ